MFVNKFFNIQKSALNLLVFILAFLLCLTGCSPANDITTATADTTATNVTTGTSASDITTNAPEIPKPTKKVALTFDDGPHKTYTVGIVNELEKYGFHATFFVVGNRVDGTSYGGGSALSYVLKRENEVAIHGYTHLYSYDGCSDEKYESEISKTVEAIKGVAPEYDVKLMRPIGGSISKSRIEASPYSIILWNVDSEDWKHKYSSGDSAQEKAEKINTIVDNVMSNVEDGSIILMHDIYESTYDAVKIILARLQAEGYEVVTVSELLGEPVPGKKYNSKE